MNIKTVSIYQKTQDGMLRLGTFTPKKYYSVQAISQQYMNLHPNADAKNMFIAFRRRIMGQIVDSERVPFDLGESR